MLDYIIIGLLIIVIILVIIAISKNVNEGKNHRKIRYFRNYYSEKNYLVFK